jgi:hypothetical protein
MVSVLVDKNVLNKLNMTEECIYEVYNLDYGVIIRGHFTSDVDKNIIKYIAPNPPDYRGSFSGSGLPFSSEKQAFDETTNVGTIELNALKQFQIKMQTPNSYYFDFSCDTPITPYVIIIYRINDEEKQIKIQINQGIPYRTLTHRENRDELFYFVPDAPIRTQEQILIDSQYPKNGSNKNESHWGLKPPA